MGIKKIIKLSLLLSGLTYSVTGHSATVNLDFTVYTQHKSICDYVGCTNYDYYDNPIISSYQVVVDTSSFTNSAYTNAFDNSPNYTERVMTDMHGSSGVYPTNFFSNYAGVSQTYTQTESGGSIVGDMRIGSSFSDNFNTAIVEERTYTGNLPPELAPESGTATIVENGFTSFNWESVIGVNPNFVVFDEPGLIAFYDSLIGEQFNYSESRDSNTCLGVLDMYGGCTGQWTGYANIYNNGYATLSVTTVVPVPAAVWLFGSGLIGLVGIARRKKS